jgi:hypothetical protein
MPVMRQQPEARPEIVESDLHHWRMLQEFAAAVQRAAAKLGTNLAEPDRERKLSQGRYLGLFLFGLFNPIIESMRGLCAITGLARVQEEVSGMKVALASFSEMQHVIDPALLHEVFKDLAGRTPAPSAPDPALAKLKLIAQDGSLWRALPRMVWAEYGVGRDGEANGVRLHLRFNLIEGKPEDLQVQRGKSCERRALRAMCLPGQINVGDRYYGEDYKLLADVARKGGFFVFRFRESAVINVEEELALTAEDRAAGVVRHLWATLGATDALRSIRVRVVEIRTHEQHLFLATNLPVEQASAALVGLIYRKRWDIELFFRWIKCVLGCRHFFAESPQGVALQLYLALIASLLFQHYTGRRPNKRLMELIHFYMMGWVGRDELVRLLEKQMASMKTGKKS